MKTLQAIVALEWRRSRAVLLSCALLLMLLTLLGLASGWQHHQHQLDNATRLSNQHNASVAALAERSRKREAKLRKAGKPLSPDKNIYRNPAYVAQEGTPALLPEGPLALLSVGQSPLLPQSVKITLKDPALLETQENLQHPLQLWTGHFDLIFVWVYILPLLLIALSFDLTASEQQAGTLKMLLVQGGELTPLVIGKLLARFTMLVVLLALSGAVAVWGAQNLGLALPTARLGAMAAVLLVYGCGWLSLAALLNAWAWKPATIAATLAACWLTGAWLIPAAGEQLLQGLVPVPPRISYIQAYREASESVRQESSRLLGQYLEDHPELAGGADNRYAMLQLTKEAALAEAIRPVVQNYEARLQRQQAAGRWLSLLSPVALAEQTLMHLAGSDLARYQDFRRQSDAFQARWKAHFLPLIERNQALVSPDFGRLPEFAYAEPRLSSRAAELGLRVGLLLLLALGLGAWALQRYRRYAVVDESPL